MLQRVENIILVLEVVFIESVLLLYNFNLINIASECNVHQNQLKNNINFVL